MSRMRVTTPSPAAALRARHRRAPRDRLVGLAAEASDT